MYALLTALNGSIMPIDLTIQFVCKKRYSKDQMGKLDYCSYK